MDLYVVTICYNARQENAITNITQKNIQRMYAKLQIESRTQFMTY